MERRTFLARIVQLCSAAIAGLMALPVFRFLSGNSQNAEAVGWIPILNTDENIFSENVIQVTFSRVLRDGWMTSVAEEAVWVRKKEDGSFLVFEPHCTHLGCNVSWNDTTKHFECPCHGGRYDADGKRIAGPPPRPLDRYEVRIENGALEIGRVMKSRG